MVASKVDLTVLKWAECWAIQWVACWAAAKAVKSVARKAGNWVLRKAAWSVGKWVQLKAGMRDVLLAERKAGQMENLSVVEMGKSKVDKLVAYLAAQRAAPKELMWVKQLAASTG